MSSTLTKKNDNYDRKGKVSEMNFTKLTFQTRMSIITKTQRLGDKVIQHLFFSSLQFINT